MRSCGLAIVRHAHEHGFLIWDVGMPRLSLSPDPVTMDVVRPHWNTIRAVLRRAEAFRRQLSTPSPDPFVRFRDPKWTAEGCPSCGGSMRAHELRCALCALAVTLALEGMA